MKRWYRSGLCTALAFSMLAIPAPVLAVETDPTTITQPAPDEEDYRVEIVELNETDFVVIGYYKDQVKSKTYGSKGGKTIRIVTYLDENNQPLAQPTEEIRNVADTIRPVFPVTTYEGTVYAEGQPVVCLNEEGKKVPILVHQGTTYIPIRTAGEWMGKNVTWDNATRTVRLTGTTEKTFYNRFDEAETPSAITITENDRMELDSGIAVTLDGKKQVFKNVKGEEVYPMVLNGTTYLPLRSIGELTGMEVLWVAPSAATGNADYTYLRTPVTDAQKTEISDYTKQQNDLLKQLAPALKDLSAQTNTKENLETVKTTLKKMAEMKTPSAKVADFYGQRYQAVLKDVQTSADKITEKTTDSDLDILTRTMRYNCITAEDYLHTLAAIGEQSGLSTLEKIDFEPEAGQGPTQEELDQWDAELKKSLVNGDYPRNSKGETYGSERLARFVGHKPDLIAVVGEDMKGNEKAGYIRDSDVPFPEVKTPEDAQKYMEYLKSLPAEIEYPLYDSEGNVIGKFFSHNPTAD